MRHMRRVRWVWRMRRVRSVIGHACALLRRPVVTTNAQFRLDALGIQGALAVHTLRSPAHARIGNALYPGSRADRVMVLIRQRAAIAPGAVVGKHATVSIAATAPVRYALALRR